jgi:hypothetical protein
MLEFTQAYDTDRGDQHLVRLALERDQAALERFLNRALRFDDDVPEAL